MQFFSTTGLTWGARITFLISILQQVLAYRPVQHCKTLGDNGHYSACAALTQHYNETTGVSDMYLRYHWFRYRNSNHGWHSFALGQKMDGALMFIMYGDPNKPSLPMTVDVRSSNGHSPPSPVGDFERFANHVPGIEIVTAVFEEYKGDLKIESLNEKPTHVGICEAIVRGYEIWNGYKATNTSTGMDFLWSSNYEQDMKDDFSHGRNIDMHKFGLGFGFVYADMLNALTPTPMFGPIDEMAGMKGVAEVRAPAPPTPAELVAGAAYISQHKADIDATAPQKPTPATQDTPTASSVAEAQPTTSFVAQDQPFEQPVRTILGKSLRDWMWHLHGLMMTIAFLALYPLGTYFIRSGKSDAFRTHWVIQALATIAMVIGSIIGYVNSYSISIKHQYIGIALFFAIGIQGVLGWRHHMQFINEKRKGWLSTAHILLGRVILPLGFVNIILGMLRREYGWFTMTLVIIVIVLETVFLGFFLYRASKKKPAMGNLRATDSAPMGDEAEEYFQLAGDDDFSDSDEDEEARIAKEQAKQEKAERLRRLDKV